MSDASTKKRKVEEPADTPPLTCHGSLWYDDGNLLVVADYTLFRVHQGVLSSHSPVLKASITMAEPSEDAPKNTKEGCLKITLDDAKEDVQHLIESLYDSRGIKATQVPFLTVSTWLRLGTKYQIEHLRKDAIRRLEICYPDTLDGYRATLDPTFPARRPIELIHGQCQTVGEEFLVAHIAMAYKLWRILPTALYLCNRWQLRALFPMMDTTFGRFGVGIPRDGAAFLRRVLHGRETLRDETSRASLILLQATRDDPGCNASALRVIHRHLETTPRLFPSANLFDIRTISLVSLSTDTQPGTCDRCVAIANEMLERKQRIAWDKLPSIFSLELEEKDWPRSVAQNVTDGTAAVQPVPQVGLSAVQTETQQRSTLSCAS